MLKRFGRLPVDKAAEIARQICAGVAAAHKAGVLHRDLKPANVMIDEAGEARATDFGLAASAVFAYLFARHGLLSVMACYFVVSLCVNAPLTTDTSS